MVDDKDTLILSIHVDDTVVAGKAGDCNSLFDALSRKFPMTNLAELAWWYTGCRFNQDWSKSTLTMDRIVFVDNLMERSEIDFVCELPATSLDYLGPRHEDEEGGN